jgi:hypothetical protein
LSIGIDRTRTLRGAVCGAFAAAVWAFEQPLDKALLASRYDDVELLGKVLVSGQGSYPAGLAVHVSHGALFGAVYSNVAPSVPLSSAFRGPALALAEHLFLWPLVAITDRFHPARDQLPALSGNRRAFVQATLRHLLFGLVLGELERKVNAAPEPAPLDVEAVYSSNGHGSLEHAVPLGS